MRATGEELERGLRHVARAPTASGILEALARRPDYGEREVLESAVLDDVEGLVGDSWHWRHNTRTSDGRPDPLGQRATGMRVDRPLGKGPNRQRELHEPDRAAVKGTGLGAGLAQGGIGGPDLRMRVRDLGGAGDRC